MIRFFIKVATFISLFVLTLVALSFFDLKLQDVGEKLDEIGHQSWLKKPMAALKDFSEETIPSWARKARRKLLTLKKDVVPIQKAQNPKKLSGEGTHEQISQAEKQELKQLLDEP